MALIPAYRVQEVALKPPTQTVPTAYRCIITCAGSQLSTIATPIGGSLPAGLILTNGVLSGSGTPSASSTGTFRILAMSMPMFCSGFRDYSYTINPANCGAAPTLVLLPAANALDTLVKGTVGVQFSQVFEATGIAGATYMYALSGALPAGLVFASSASSASISGTPSATANVNLRVIASSNGGCLSAATIYKLVINRFTSVDHALSKLIKVYPNPFSSEFNIDFGAIDINKATVKIYDGQGRKVFGSDIKTNLMQISLGKLANGIYLIELQTSQTRVLKKVTKQN